VGKDNHLVFGKKFSGEKGSVRQCVVVMQLVAKLRGDIFAYFQAITVNVTVVLF
jgi:hypothetical protein